MFQSPQWGKCSKVVENFGKLPMRMSFSPRNGESVLKNMISELNPIIKRFSPRNGESVLKLLRMVGKCIL